MIKTNNKGQLIVISGPSGVGKGVICNEILKVRKKIWLSISVTTREPRKNEVEGKNYYYITKEKFEEKIKKHEFLEYAKVFNDDYYGTPKDKVIEKLNNGIDVILEIDINGALQINNTYNDAVFIFIMPPSIKELFNRIYTRSTESKDKIIERFKRAYKEINEVSKYNYVVVNDNINKALEKVNSIIIAQKCRVDRIDEVYLNTIEEFIHENLID